MPSSPQILQGPSPGATSSRKPATVLPKPPARSPPTWCLSCASPLSAPPTPSPWASRVAPGPVPLPLAPGVAQADHVQLLRLEEGQKAMAQAHLAHIRDGVRVALHQATRQPGLHVCRCHCLWDTDAQRRGLSGSCWSRGHTAPYRTGREWQPRRPPFSAVRD